MRAFPDPDGSGENDEVEEGDDGDAAVDAKRQPQARASRAVPKLYRRMATTDDGDLKVPVALRSE
ncbi:hypothetical protein ABZ890_43055 [Streptomyces sp. NPDC046984]|uniref:hypothetical protein n=1 Tax=Streptomyces sp. NPDC046984 TaxID=3155138 RepID=UPI00340F3909